MTTNFAIQFLIWLLIAASIIAVVAQRLRIRIRLPWSSVA